MRGRATGEDGDEAPPDLVRRVWPGRVDLPPVVLLHGSGQDETSLLDTARAACPGRALVAVRGRIPWEGGFAFFRRRPDRTLDEDDLALGAVSVQRLLGQVHRDGEPGPVLVGYSNGAVTAVAALLLDHRLVSATVLLRPLSPWPGRLLPPLEDHPVLLVTGADDHRRAPDDGRSLAAQLRAAGARAQLHELPTGHGLTPADARVVQGWVHDLDAAGSPG